jgi:hypothetical protein
MKRRSLSEDSLINKLKKENFVYKSISSDSDEIDDFPEKIYTKIQIVEN